MYLKRLELQGFKSFAGRTLFEFGPGITAIVGPNGAGKTNVAEAIRWVLGEQLGRTLRARRSEDVVFAGSSRRPPVGMAEASMALDNADGWLPLDFAEVVVTRRAYRNGEGEYLINRSRVRHRDVTDLFLKAQVGQNSYAFMGQGLVEAVLSLRPEERRGLIEEAADVRLYRSRLDEARDRLAATEENLERVGLLVAEIEPRLAQLERQAGRAATYAHLSQELAKTLQEWYGQLWQDVQEALAAARAVADQRQEECERARQDSRACEEALAAVRSAIEEHRRDIASRERAHRDLEQYVRDLERRVALDQERGAMLEAHRGELAADLVSLREERSAQEAAVDPEAESALAASIEETRRDLPGREQEAARLETALREAQKAAANGEQAAARARLATAEASARLAEIAAAEERLRSDLAGQEESRRTFLDELRDWARGFAALGRDVASLRVAAIQAETDCRELEGRLQDDRSAIASLEEELRSTRSRIETLEARRDLFGSVDTRPVTPDAGIRVVLAAAGILPDDELAGIARLEGVRGLVGHLLRVPPGLERAIEAALAENLHAIVVERQEHLEAAVELLCSDDFGRAQIYPLDGTREIQPLRLLKERGVVGVASELVRCDGRYRKLVETLLGRTIVVENLAMARTVLKRGLGSVVTLDGILLRPIGSVSAGSFRTVREAFARERILQETPEELERLQARLGEIEASLGERRRSADEAGEALSVRARVAESLRDQARARQEAQTEQRRRLAALGAHLQAAHAEVRRARPRLAELATSREATARQQALEAAAAGEADRRARQARERAAELLARKASLAEEIAALTARLNSLEGEARALAAARRAREEARAGLERQLATKDQQLRRVEEEAATVASRLDSTQRELQARLGELETLERDLAPAREALAQIESRERSLGAELTAAQGRALAAERGLADAESEVRIREQEMESVHATIEAEGLRVEEGVVIPVVGQSGTPPSWLASEGAKAVFPEEGLPPVRGGSQVDPVRTRERIAELRARIRSLGPVNEQAESDYAESRERYDFLTGQMQDLRQADASLRQAIGELEEIVRDRFKATFEQVNEGFQRYFATFFGGGTARLILSRDHEPALGGVEIEAQPPGKRVGSLAMLSGGERALTAVALLFALLQAHPSPICVLDEVDAALDEANVGRFVEALRELAERTQFIIITHNRRTIEMADTIYGISMGEDSTSSVLSLRLSDISSN